MNFLVLMHDASCLARILRDGMSVINVMKPKGRKAIIPMPASRPTRCWGSGMVSMVKGEQRGV